MSAGRAAREVAVVVASFRAPHLLEACLASIETARARYPDPVSVYVARSGSGADVSGVLSGRPWAVLVPVPEPADVPRLRGAGMTAARAPCVLVTEDHCLVSPGWIEALASEVDDATQVVGGGMGNARPGGVNWGAFFSEYGFFSAARPPDQGHTLMTGANVCYGPAVSRRVAAWAVAGHWEDRIHGRLAGEGVGSKFVPAAEVRQNAEYSFGAFCVDRYEHGRDYARARLQEHPETRRLLRCLTAPVLPWILLLRVGRAAASSNPRAFAAALPFTSAFLAAWSLGEAVGYLTGGRG